MQRPGNNVAARHVQQFQHASGCSTFCRAPKRFSSPLFAPAGVKSDAAAAATAALEAAAVAAAAPGQYPRTKATAIPLKQRDPEEKSRHKRPPGWVAPGPAPAALSVLTTAPSATSLQSDAALSTGCSEPSGLPKPQAGESLSFLTGNWRIFQLQKGHRWSMDDMMTAYVALQTVQQPPLSRPLLTSPAQDADSMLAAALQAAPAAGPAARSRVDHCAASTADVHAASVPTGFRGLQHVLDLGCGVGSVLLMVAWGLRRMHMEQQQQDGCQFDQQKQPQQPQQPQQQQPFDVTSLGVEAQSVSYQLAQRSIAYNLGRNDGLVQALHQDLRASLPPEQPQAFQLITGTPPYIPLGAGVQSNKPQKGPCCVETRGGIEDYCQAAAARLAPGGHFVVCCGLQGQPLKGKRVQQAAAAARLVITRQVTVITREGKPPLFAVYVMQPAADVVAAASVERANRVRTPPAPGNHVVDADAAEGLAAQVAAGQLEGSEELFIVRHRSGLHTAAWHTAREAMGLPPLQEE